MQRAGAGIPVIRPLALRYRGRLRGPQGREDSLVKRPTNRKRDRPEGVVAKLRAADEALAMGVTNAEVARSLGVSEVTLHSWRAQYGTVDRDAVRRLKER